VSEDETGATEGPDIWNERLTKIVQVLGILMIATQFLISAAAKAQLLPDADPDPEPWLLLVASAMILGGYGMRLLVRGALGIIGQGGQK
jgi:hypothetical protein